jgi:hypothetical protein
VRLFFALAVFDSARMVLGMELSVRPGRPCLDDGVSDGEMQASWFQSTIRVDRTAAGLLMSIRTQGGMRGGSGGAF